MKPVAVINKDTIKEVTLSQTTDKTHIEISPVSYAIIQSALLDEFTVKIPDGITNIDYPNLVYLKNENQEPVTLYLANIYKSSKNFITGISTKKSNELFDLSLYCVITKEVYDFLSKNSQKMIGQKFYIEENVTVILDPKQILVISEENSIEVLTEARHKALDEAKLIMVDRFDVRIMLDFFTFILYNNDLASKGYFITDENREEKYMEIVNADDEDLLNKLSDYLKALDELHRYNQYFALYKNFIEKVNADDATLESIDVAFTEFKKEFN